MKDKNRRCPNCDSIIKGRIDKIFCSIGCKSAHQYQNRMVEDAFFIKVDRQLKVNRKTLKKYNLHGKTTLRRSVLHQEGFNPNFFTHFWKNNKGDVYFFCYDFGFMKLKEKTNSEVKEKYLIVEWQDYMKKAFKGKTSFY